VLIPTIVTMFKKIKTPLKKSPSREQYHSQLQKAFYTLT